MVDTETPSPGFSGPPHQVTVISSERLHPPGVRQDQAKALSLLDATTANFSLTSAVWLFEAPNLQAGIDVTAHLKQSLRITLGAYPHLCGQLKSFTTLDGSCADPIVTKDFPPAAKRFGRVYVHYGSTQDPGVEVVVARSTATLDDLYPTKRSALWDRTGSSLSEYLSKSRMGKALEATTPIDGLLPPSMSIQLTTLACGALAFSARLLHPLGDIISLTCILKDWASLSRAALAGTKMPVLAPVFEPEALDARAAGIIDAEQPDESRIESAKNLPMHRFDWWAEPDSCPWGVKIPPVFRDQDVQPAGVPMPWHTWDLTGSVSAVMVRFTRVQVQNIWEAAAVPPATAAVRISKHDAVLAHIWACITRARQRPSPDAYDVVHCNLTLGARPALGLGSSFQGSPIVIANITAPATQVCTASIASPADMQSLAQRIRSTLDAVSSPAAIGAHLHCLAYESSPQRIWQAFMGTRHILVTTWARAGVYEVDFGFREGNAPAVRFVDAVLSPLDGGVLVNEAPPVTESVGEAAGGSGGGWTDRGVDVALWLKSEDMERFLGDPLLLP